MTVSRRASHCFGWLRGTKLPPYVIALSWLLHKAGHIIPIPGASRVQSILASLDALDVNLAPADLAAIDALPDK
jgi:aryl-alcohol dehydrogenase-like predicted oxidoreductase